MHPSPLVSASLYVGDLHPDVTESELLEVFSVAGPVASIRVLRDTMTRRSLGYAYVNFHNVVDAERALDTLNYSAVRNKPIRIMWKHRDPAKRRSGVGNIFIKNLDKTIDSRALNDTFSQFGNILSCKVATDENGVSKGYAFVQYETQEDADDAVKKVNGNLIEGKRVFVGPFLPLSERVKSGDQPKFTNVFCKNLDDEVTTDMLKEKFAAFGPITSAVVQTKEDGTSKCFGFVNFENPDSARDAVEKMNDSSPWGGKKLVVCKAEKASARQAELRKQWDERKMELMRKYQGTNLYVKNLDDTIDDEKLRQVFSEFGTVTSVKVESEGGKSKGFGYVCFTSSDDATKAVTNMNGKMVGNKPIFVALHQPKDIRRAQLQSLSIQRQFNNAQNMGPRGFPQQGMPMMYPAGARPSGPAGQLFMFPPPGPMAGRPFGPRPGMQAGMGRGGAGNRGYRPGGRGQPQPGQPGAQPGQQPRGQQVKFNPGVRNQREQGAAPDQAQPQQQMPVQPLPVVPGALSKEQLAHMLVNASPEQQKQLLGERLYALIAPSQGQLTGKITGMLLEGLDNGELLHLIDSQEALEAKIQEAIQALQAHMDGGEN